MFCVNAKLSFSRFTIFISSKKNTDTFHWPLKQTCLSCLGFYVVICEFSSYGFSQAQAKPPFSLWRQSWCVKQSLVSILLVLFVSGQVHIIVSIFGAISACGSFAAFCVVHFALFTFCCSNCFMRIIQYQLADRDARQDFAFSQSDFLACIWWWFPNAILVSTFLDKHSRYRFWHVNTVVYIDSSDVQFAVGEVYLGIYSPELQDWEVPTPPLQIFDQWQ